MIATFDSLTSADSPAGAKSPARPYVPRFSEMRDPPPLPRQKAPNAHSPLTAIPRLYDDDRYRNLKPSWMAILKAIIDRADRVTSMCTRSFEKLAGDANCSTRTIQRAVHHFAEVRLIDYEPGGGRGNKGGIRLLWATWGLPRSRQLQIGFVEEERMTDRTSEGGGNSPPVGHRHASSSSGETTTPHPPVAVSEKGRAVPRDEHPPSRIIATLCEALGYGDARTRMEVFHWSRNLMDVIREFGVERTEQAVALMVARYTARGGFPPNPFPMIRWWAANYYTLIQEAALPAGFSRRDNRKGAAQPIAVGEPVGSLFDGVEMTPDALLAEFRKHAAEALERAGR